MPKTRMPSSNSHFGVFSILSITPPPPMAIAAFPSRARTGISRPLNLRLSQCIIFW